ncbi:MAG: hypothetical protein IT289_07765 [Oligoflexia bacterium]|nr:hypothetical protein [Oligoflexia bacterium]
MNKRLIASYWVLLAVTIPVLGCFLIPWVQTHGFVGGMILWFRHAAFDPVYAFGVVDFLVLQIAVGIALLTFGLKMGWATRWHFWFVGVLYVVSPSIGFLTYALAYMRRVKAN